MTELVAVIAERQGFFDIVGQGREFAEMLNPGLIIEPIKPYTRCRTVVAKPQLVIGKRRRCDRPVETLIKRQMDRRGLIGD